MCEKGVCDNFVIIESLECHCVSVYFKIVREDSCRTFESKES